MSIMAWRMWNVQLSHNFTFGYVMNGMFGAHWYPGETMQAKCNRTNINAENYPNPKIAHILNALSPPHYANEIPAPHCTCGVYATKLAPLLTPLTIQRQVMGVTEIWGNIIVAEHGYRAQYAKLRAIVDDTPEPNLYDQPRNYGGPNLATIASDYQVPLLPSIRYARQEFFT